MFLLYLEVTMGKVDVIYAMDSEKTHQLLIDVLKNYRG